MILYLLEPEVAGDFGDNTIVENFNLVRQKGERPKIKHLHYNFTGWLGDELLECTPCFIVSDTLAKSIKESPLSGYDFENIEISADDEFKEIHPHISIPKFMRLIPKGYVDTDGEKYTKWSGDDFCLSQKSYLIVTEEVLKILKSHKMDYCDITSLEKEKI